MPIGAKQALMLDRCMPVSDRNHMHYWLLAAVYSAAHTSCIHRYEHSDTDILSDG